MGTFVIVALFLTFFAFCFPRAFPPTKTQNEEANNTQLRSRDPYDRMRLIFR